MDFNFKYYGQFDVSSIENKLKINTLDWDYYTFRQTYRKGQQDTKTLPLIWSEDFTENKKWEYYSVFEDDINEVENTLKSILGDGRITIAILINLPKNKKILPHTDSGNDHFFITNRLHIPITTNDECWFRVSDEVKQMKKGEIWEINNSDKVHSVDNDGDTDRIHLLIDYQLANKKLT